MRVSCYICVVAVVCAWCCKPVSPHCYAPKSCGHPLTPPLARPAPAGGSFLGPLFVHTALKTEPTAMKLAGERTLHFLANVDPIDVSRALHGLDPEETLVRAEC